MTLPLDAMPSPTPQFNELLQCIKNKYNCLSVEVHSDKMAHWAVIHGKMTTVTPINTPVHNPRMIVHAPHNGTDMKFIFEANFITIFSGNTTDDSFNNLLQSMLSNSGYFLCPGMPLDIVEKCTFEAKNVRKWMSPFHRIDHKECEQWFRAPLKKSIHAPTCSKCIKLRHYLVTEVRRRAAVTSTQKEKRALPTSRCPVKYLTPCTRRMRMALLRKETNYMQRKVHCYKKYDINVGTATQNELIELVAHISRTSNIELQKVLAEADRAGKGDVLRMKWKQDVDERGIKNEMVK